MENRKEINFRIPFKVYDKGLKDNYYLTNYFFVLIKRNQHDVLIFTKKEFVNKNGEQISYNGYLGKEKPKNYVIYLDGEEISIDWNESDIMIV